MTRSPDHPILHWLQVTVKTTASYFPLARDSTAAWTACPPAAGQRALMGPESSNVALTGTASRLPISMAWIVSGRVKSLDELTRICRPELQVDWIAARLLPQSLKVAAGVFNVFR